MLIDIDEDYTIKQRLKLDIIPTLKCIVNGKETIYPG